MVGEWQTACHYKKRDSGAGWAAAWRLTAHHLGHIKTADQAAIIGQELHYSTLGQKYAGYADSIDVKSLRQNDRKEKSSWLYLSACLLRKIKPGLNSNLEPGQTHQQLWPDDPMLAWRILSWYILGPPE